MQGTVYAAPLRAPQQEAREKTRGQTRKVNSSGKNGHLVRIYPLLSHDRVVAARSRAWVPQHVNQIMYNAQSYHIIHAYPCTRYQVPEGMHQLKKLMPVRMYVCIYNIQYVSSFLMLRGAILNTWYDLRYNIQKPTRYIFRYSYYY